MQIKLSVYTEMFYSIELSEKYVTLKDEQNFIACIQ